MEFENLSYPNKLKFENHYIYSFMTFKLEQEH